jgi:hypothetical protein
LSSSRNNDIEDEIRAYEQFRKYIKDNPESEAALTVKSAGRKRKAFCIMGADDEDSEDETGSPDSGGENETPGSNNPGGADSASGDGERGNRNA